VVAAKNHLKVGLVVVPAVAAKNHLKVGLVVVVVVVAEGHLEESLAVVVARVHPGLSLARGMVVIGVVKVHGWDEVMCVLRHSSCWQNSRRTVTRLFSK